MINGRRVHRFILCQNYMMFLLVLNPPPYFEAEYCLFCSRRRVAVARYRMICLVLSMTKAPTPTKMSKGQNDNTNNATKKFDYRAVEDRLRTVSWSNYGHPTVVVNLVYGPNLPTPHNSRVIKMTHV